MHHANALEPICDLLLTHLEACPTIELAGAAFRAEQCLAAVLFATEAGRALPENAAPPAEYQRIARWLGRAQRAAAACAGMLNAEPGVPDTLRASFDRLPVTLAQVRGLALTHAPADLLLAIL